MALSIPTYGKKKPVTLQTEQQQVATPAALGAPRVKAPPKPAAPPPPSPPREEAPKQTYGAPRPPGALNPMEPSPKPVQPGAGNPPSGTYDVPTPAPTPPPAPEPLPETLPMTATADTAEVISNAPDSGLFEASEPSPPGDNQFDAQVRQLMADLLAGKGMDVSTAEEEALIRELMQDRLGAGLVEQRAKMGRAGFGASGALAAMEGDIRRQAGQQATQETLAIRRQAEQEAIDNALRAIGVDVDKRREGRAAAFDEEFLNALKSSMEQEQPDAAAGPLDDAAAAVGEKGLVGAAPELAADAFGAWVRLVYGENADPNDYYMSPGVAIPVKIPGR